MSLETMQIRLTPKQINALRKMKKKGEIANKSAYMRYLLAIDMRTRGYVIETWA